MPYALFIETKDLNPQQKKDIYYKIVNTFQIPMGDEVIKEPTNRNIYDYQHDLKNELTIEEKMKLYNSAINDNLDEFKSYINETGNFGKPYNFFEEMSAPGYKRTVFLYAMHYGKWEIIKFIIEHLNALYLLEKALGMKTNDKRCPFICLLKSNELELKQKKLFFQKL